MQGEGTFSSVVCGKAGAYDWSYRRRKQGSNVAPPAFEKQAKGFREPGLMPLAKDAGRLPAYARTLCAPCMLFPSPVYAVILPPNQTNLPPNLS